MIRVAVVDDIKEYTEKIQQIIEKVYGEKNVTYEVKAYTMPRELQWDLEQNEYFDIYFIDIEMPGLNGLDLAQKIREKYDAPYIIFVTSYMQYSIEGYEYNAYRYITKDTMEEKVSRALESLENKLSVTEKKKYVFENYSSVSKVNYEDIFHIGIKGKYAYFTTATGEFRERNTLKNVYKGLDDPAFVYVDKGRLINLRHVLELRDRKICLRNGETFEVSEAKYQGIKKQLSDYWRKSV